MTWQPPEWEPTPDWDAGSENAYEEQTERVSWDEDEREEDE